MKPHEPLTGGTGFVGKPTVAALIAAGHGVRVLGDATDGHGYMEPVRASRSSRRWPGRDLSIREVARGSNAMCKPFIVT